VEHGICPIVTFLLPVKNPASPSCSTTPISNKMKKFLVNSATRKGQIAYFSLRMRKTAIFLLPFENLTSSSCSPTPISYEMREFWRYANIAFFIFAWIFRTSGSKMGIFRGKIGKGVRRYWLPTDSFLLLGVYTSESNLVKIDKEMRPWEWRHTDTQTDANRFYYLSHAICYSYRAYKNTAFCVCLHFLVNWSTDWKLHFIENYYTVS